MRKSEKWLLVAARKESNPYFQAEIINQVLQGGLKNSE